MYNTAQLTLILHDLLQEFRSAHDFMNDYRWLRAFVSEGPAQGFYTVVASGKARTLTFRVARRALSPIDHRAT